LEGFLDFLDFPGDILNLDPQMIGFSCLQTMTKMLFQQALLAEELAIIFAVEHLSLPQMSLAGPLI
jgi:hypothetical protein